MSWNNQSAGFYKICWFLNNITLLLQVPCISWWDIVLFLWISCQLSILACLLFIYQLSTLYLRWFSCIHFEKIVVRLAPCQDEQRTWGVKYMNILIETWKLNAVTKEIFFFLDIVFEKQKIFHDLEEAPNWKFSTFHHWKDIRLWQNEICQKWVQKLNIMILLVGKNKHSDGDALGHPTVLMKLCSYLNVLCVVLSYDEHLQRSHVVFVITMSCSMLDYMQ